MSLPWFRMYSEFATDPKVQMLSEVDQRRFVMLLCLRCSNGDVTLHETEVAFQLRISNEEWAATKQILMEKKLIGDDNKPLAWDQRQYASDSSAARVKRHRERKKTSCNVTVTPPDTDTDTDTEKNSDANASLVGDKSPPSCPHKKIIELYHERLPMCTRIRAWSQTRQKLLTARWRSNPDYQSPDWWEKFFSYISDSDFLTGQTGGRNGQPPFLVDLEWIVRPANFVKIIEGKYHREAAHG